MKTAYVVYDLQDGFIMNWLAAGPQAIPVEAPKDPNDTGAKLQITQKMDDQKIGIGTAPVERGPLTEGTFKIGDYEGSWSYYSCREDHLVDHSAAYPACQYLRSWAYTRLTSQADQTARFVLSTFGPVDVWVNKKNVFHSQQIFDQRSDFSFEAGLKAGQNQVMVRFAGVSAPDCTLAVALRVEGQGLQVQIPTLIPSISRRNELEAVNKTVYLDRDVYAAEDTVYLKWPEGAEKSAYQDVRFQTPAGWIYAHAEDKGRPGTSLFLGSPPSLKEGPYRAYIMPRAWEMYESNIRVTHELECWVMGANRFSDGPYGTLEERAQEALINAARREGELFGEIAKIALGARAQIEVSVVEQAIERINQRQAGCEIELLGLLGMIARFDKPDEVPGTLIAKIQECILNFRYAPNEPGADLLPFDREDRQIIFYACQVLAGQLYPNQNFSNCSMTGKQQRKKGEALALAWIQKRGEGGFIHWDSPEVYANTLTALSYLVDLSKSEAIWELGSVLMDKLFYALALNSYKGVFGSTRGQSGSLSVRSGLLEETSGITRLMWGMGVFNAHIAGPVSLACVKKYELPPIIPEIAAGLPAEMWDREQQSVEGSTVNKVTYRTPDYMLCSAQDYRPGQPGRREHIWQATLGPQSIVFVNHPGCAGENDAHTPNFWLGNGVLPRTAQWKDTLIALYHLPEDSWSRLTHAYFPTLEFDEYILRENTAFARKGSGYLALTTAQGLELVQSGRSAYRELRSTGAQNAWVCQMGRAAVDGDFSAFQEKVLAARPAFDGLKVACQTLRGETLTFDWEGPLLVNGEAQALSGFMHYDNPYSSAELPCKQMEIKTDDYLLRLNFGDL